MSPRLYSIYRRDKGICWLCGQSVAQALATADHVMPRSAGGPNAKSNLKLAHRSCNEARGNTFPHELSLPLPRPASQKRKLRGMALERHEKAVARRERVKAIMEAIREQSKSQAGN